MELVIGLISVVLLIASMHGVPFMMTIMGLGLIAGFSHLYFTNKLNDEITFFDLFEGPFAAGLMCIGFDIVVLYP
jgi:hypothetical protein